MRPLTWLKLMRRGRFRFSLSRLTHGIGATIATPWNTALAGLQRIFFGSQIANAELHGPPVFIIGHWRSGTTLMHELLVRDERLSSPSTYQCFAPHHFLATEWIARRFFSWLLPKQRPMDNMAAGWERPQEDEFALMNMGLPCPYRRIAFPNEGFIDMNYLDFDGLSQTDKDHWLSALREFLERVSIVTGRPLVIKSPTHTGRIAALAKEFPDAKFVHLTRDPRDLLPSTLRLWRGLCDAQSMQNPNHEDELEYVVECFQRMYNAFERDRESVEPQRMIDVRFEDLVANPVEIMGDIYSQLHLSDFEPVRETLQQWADNEHRSYKRNQHQLSDEHQALLNEVWGDYMQRYGY